MLSKMGSRASTANALTALVLAVALVAGAPSALSAQDVVKVVQVAVSGNQNINTDTIRNAISLKVGEDYTEQAVQKDRAAIMSLAYFSAVTVHRDDVPGGIRITYEVTENPRITDVRVVGSDPIPAQKILDLMKTKAGKVLNIGTLNQDIEAIQQYYGEQGYLAYVTEIEDGIDPQTGVLTIPILVHMVESVQITGNKKTKEYVFLREMKTRPGEVFNVQVLNDDIMRIFNLDILEDIKPSPSGRYWEMEPGSEVGMLKITVQVVEKKTGQISLGFGYSSRQKLVGQARLSETNFRGKGQGLNVLFEQGTSNAVGGSSSYELGFYEPWIDSRHTSVSVSGFNKILYRFSSGIFGGGTFADDKTYNERRKGGDLTLSRPITDKMRVYVGGRFESVDTDPSLLAGNTDLINIVQEGDVTSGSIRLVHNTRDFDLDPAAGGYEGISLQLGTVDAIRFQDTDPDPLVTVLQQIPFKGAFRKGTIDIRRYFSPLGRKTMPQDKRTTIAVRLLAGIASGKLPFFEQFFVGGGESLRGYREDRFWGNKMLLLSAEFRKPIAQSISGVIFLDYGGAWDGDPEFFIGELAQHERFRGNFGYGVGMRVKTPIGHIRLDYGMGSEGGRTHFSMGHAF